MQDQGGSVIICEECHQVLLDELGGRSPGDIGTGISDDIGITANRQNCEYCVDQFDEGGDDE
jgi:hypothetical protein